ncbi:MAG: hypothetical protein APR54_04310 [Candidatus Cloacimonas sp. SDB]|nr:MAG: hypothetical protein APR54_04310 [Candidatus Cloacimonas sp. SDB]
MKSGERFNRKDGFFHEGFTYIGTGQPGGKASGLALLQDIVSKHLPENKFEGIEVSIPNMTVLLSGVFDQFMQENSLYEIALSDASDSDIAISFIKSTFGGLYSGDLYYLIENIDIPLAIRSSSICEDSLNEPFAGVYETKMIANNQPDKTQRFTALVNAIKFVYASLFFKQSKKYFESINRDIREEKMAVIIQEVVGESYNSNYHPLISGVLKSYNFYPSENIKPEDGFAALAFGLGKTIVNGENCWSYCPKYPRSPQPFNNIRDMLENTQREYWTINLDRILSHNPIAETEYLKHKSIFDLKDNKTLFHLCSTYDHSSDTLRTGYRAGGTPVLDFSPLLKAETLPLNRLISKIMEICEKETDSKVEIEFAFTLNDHNPDLPRFGLLQLRPISVSSELVEIPDINTLGDNLLLASKNVMGNGKSIDINDIVFVRPDSFELENTAKIAAEISELNDIMIRNNRKYLLIGFGRWGTSDPWCGIPVKWPQISNAKIIVETILPSLVADFSQGAHFFHNMTSHNVFYFSVDNESAKNLDWKWLQDQKIINETRFVKHVRLKENLKVLADGRNSRGVILK